MSELPELSRRTEAWNMARAAVRIAMAADPGGGADHWPESSLASLLKLAKNEIPISSKLQIGRVGTDAERLYHIAQSLDTASAVCQVYNLMAADECHGVQDPALAHLESYGLEAAAGALVQILKIESFLADQDTGPVEFDSTADHAIQLLGNLFDRPKEVAVAEIMIKEVDRGDD